MRVFGILTAILSLVGLAVGFLMDATVESGSGRVYNIGLVAFKNNMIIASLIFLLAGIIIFSVGKRSRKSAFEVSQYKDCPFCAEKIQTNAVLCRYCNHDLPASESVAAECQVADLAGWKLSASQFFLTADKLIQNVVIWMSPKRKIISYAIIGIGLVKVVWSLNYYLGGDYAAVLVDVHLPESYAVRHMMYALPRIVSVMLFGVVLLWIPFFKNKELGVFSGKSKSDAKGVVEFLGGYLDLIVMSVSIVLFSFLLLLLRDWTYLLYFSSILIVVGACVFWLGAKISGAAFIVIGAFLLMVRNALTGSVQSITDNFNIEISSSRSYFSEFSFSMSLFILLFCCIPAFRKINFGSVAVGRLLGDFHFNILGRHIFIGIGSSFFFLMLIWAVTNIYATVIGLAQSVL